MLVLVKNKRVIGSLIIKDDWVVQSFGYKNYLPVGRAEVMAENLDRWGVDEIYINCSRGKILRGKKRRGIIAGCFYHAFKINKQNIPNEELINLFNVDNKEILKGLKYITKNISKEINLHADTIDDIEKEIINTMKKFNSNKRQNEEVIEIYKKTKNKSSILNRSRPNSLIAGIIYYWICRHDLQINMNEISNKLNISTSTIRKICREISTVLNNMKKEN